MTDSADRLLAQGRDALRRGDSAHARAAFESALAQTTSGDAVEGLARVAYIELDFPSAIAEFERAYAIFQAATDRLGAGRCARSLGYMYLSSTGEHALTTGWLARARRLLADIDESSESGWVALNCGMFEGDRSRKEALFREALAEANKHADTDLEFVALAYLGASLVHGDRVEEGMTLLDEALAAVAGQDVDDFCVLQEIFCQLFSACEHAHDVSRADQWIRIGEAIAARRKLPAVSAFCRTHYGGVLTAAGRWDEADVALTEAVRLWALGHHNLRSGALARLADLRARQGRFEEAEQLIAGIETRPEAARPLAQMHLANGKPSRAIDVLERALQQTDPLNSAAAPLLAQLVDAHLANNDVVAAETAVDALDACAAGQSNPYVAATAALARGHLCVTTGNADSQACLRAALAGFDRAHLPMELAHTRLGLARALVTDRPDVAMAEARAALEVFEKLHAARDVDAANALLRTLGVRSATGGRTTGPLSKRETEVLELVSHGLSNAEISDRLFISRKTVEHHVGNILTKLDVRTRGEAAAYLAKTKPGSK
ncbi:MAG: LuxR C-terminal-related transcriptional regulator [Acidimicrobiales bacterium]|nr:LuxR C-terminal-related transcriptional regulator [Acidimicrobiales bacterium]